MTNTYFGKVCDKHPELVGERRKNGRSCVGCARSYALRYASENRQERAAYQKDYRKKNPEVVKKHNEKYLKPWVEENKEYVRQQATERMRKWRETNRDRVKQLANRPHEVARRSGYRAKNKQATPTWANLFYIEEAYKLARMRELIVGGSWQVDHLVPLRSKQVCGLHVHSNLRVIPKQLNGSKGNRYWPQMP